MDVIKCLFFIFLLGILPIQAICKESLEDALVRAVGFCDFDNVKSLIAKGADVNAKNTSTSNSLIITLASKGLVE